MKAAALAALLLLAAAPGEISYTASSVNVAEPGIPVKIEILRWSTEDEVRPIVTALAAPPAQPSEVARATAGSPPGAARGRGAAAGGRGRATSSVNAPVAA